jgi:hypothetical protein
MFMLRRSLLACLAATVAAPLCLGLVVAAPSAAATPPTPRGLPAAIEPLAPYVGQVACDPTSRPGTVKLAHLLASAYRSYHATSWNSTYACGTDGSQSEHYDGRAIDWMVDVHNSKQRAAATSAIHWLLATDAHGNRFAMARRLGVMYIIWDNRMWGAWDGTWESYNNCNHLKQRASDNACHRTHVHISLSWNGAMGRTSYWTKRVAATDFGPCRPKDLNWAGRYAGANPVPCANYRPVKAKRSASATKKLLVRYSGAPVRKGWSGPAVAAVQRALHVPQTARFDARTVAAVRRFQSRHRLTASGVMTATTWRALLRAVH